MKAGLRCLWASERDKRHIILKQIASLIVMLASGGLVHVRLIDTEEREGQEKKKEKKLGGWILNTRNVRALRHREWQQLITKEKAASGINNRVVIILGGRLRFI